MTENRPTRGSLSARPSTWDELSRFADHYKRGVLLLDHVGELRSEDFWRAVADAWQDCDRQSLTPDDWRYLWDGVYINDDCRRENVMTDEERVQFEQLPDRVNIYRGINTRNRVSGMSWTLDRDVAHWFAGRFERDGAVTRGRVLRHRILALFQERSEAEIVVFPKFVYGREYERIDAAALEREHERRQARLERIRGTALDRRRSLST